MDEQTREDLTATIRRLAAQVLCADVATIAIDRSLRQLGAESFDLVELIHRINMQVGVSLPLRREYIDQSVEGLVRIVRAEHALAADIAAVAVDADRR